MSERIDPADVGYTYDLDEDTIDILIREKLQCEPLATDRTIVCYELSSNDPLANVARTIERQVFHDKYGNTSEIMQQEYGPYEAQSRFYLSVDQHSQKPVGSLRIIENGVNSLKVVHDFPVVTEENLRQNHGVEDMQTCWEIGTLAILPEYRGRAQVGVQYYRALYLAAKSNHITHILAAIDKKVYEKIVTGYLGLPYVQIHGTAPTNYLGSPATIPIIGTVREFFPKTLRQMATIKGMLAFRALYPLVFGTHDDALYLRDGHPILK